MNQAAVYHRPESEFAYLYDHRHLRLRVRVAKGDMKKIVVVYGDPFDTAGRKNWARKTLKKLVTTETSDIYEASVTAPHKRLDYLFLLTGADGERAVLTDVGLMPRKKRWRAREYAAFRLPYFHEVDRVRVPEWVKSTVWYQIFPERFANGDAARNPEGVKAWDPTDKPSRQDFYGGDLAGVLAHLDHLSELGVTGIYFTPIFKAASNHKYDTTDYLKIDPHFGDLALFKKLVKACHKRGIRVMLDAVFNHIGDTSAQWQDVLKNQEKSAYADWFHVNHWPAAYTETSDFEHTDDASYDTFAFTPHMPKLNTANPEVQEYLLGVAEYWIRECDIDAWRLDVADEVDHQFWKKFRAVCDAAKDDFYILGEVWHSSQPWLNGDEFSAVMNYAYTGAIVDGLVRGTLSLPAMTAVLSGQLALYRAQTSQVMFNVLDSHDTPRLLTVARGDKDLLRQVEAFTYLQPGAPCIYYGDEVGVAGGADPDSRRLMPWEPSQQDLGLFGFFQELVAFRKQYATELAESQVDFVAADDATGRLELRRGKIVGVFNTGKKALSVDATGKILLSALAGKGKIKPRGFVIWRG